MALRRTLSKRLLKSPIESPPTLKSRIPPNAANANFHRKLLTSPESSDSGGFGIFRRLLHSAMLPEFLPVGEILREKLRFAADRIRLDGLRPPAGFPASFPVSFPAPASFPAPDSGGLGGLSVWEAKKVLRSAQMERVRCALRGIQANSVTYGEYVRICIEVCSDPKLGEEFAKSLDESGSVIVLGNIVFLRPDQVARSMEKLITESIATPNDPRRRELEQLENQKAYIDQKAHKQVQTELYCGLGFLALQTLGFMRLTFWELSWDVMEPICFFVTSLHFAMAYGFFLRTSKEPTFESFSKRRFKTKQKKLMETLNFDLEKYDRLCRAFYPSYGGIERNGCFSGLEFGRVMH